MLPPVRGHVDAQRPVSGERLLGKGGNFSPPKKCASEAPWGGSLAIADIKL